MSTNNLAVFIQCKVSHIVADPEFGWKTEDMPMEKMKYTIVKVGEEGVGNMMPIPPHAQGSPPNWGDGVDDPHSRGENYFQMYIGLFRR